MCLAVPGRIVAIASAEPIGALGHASGETQAPLPVDSPLGDLPGESADTPAPEPPANPDLWRVATVDFGGVRQSVSLACLPEARLGDLVLVHVGLAICRVEESLMELTLEPIPESIPELMAPRLQKPMEAPTEAATRRSAAAPPDPVRQPSPDSTALPAWAHRPEAEA